MKIVDVRNFGIPSKVQGLVAVLLGASLSLVFLAGEGCSHKQAKMDEPVAQTADTEMGSSDAGNALGLKTVHFDFDSPTVTATDKSILTEDASILKSHPSVRIQIEGHCDARGGIQYNIALGERRANATRDFLTDQGVPGDRITTISYGKERPLDAAMTEEAYAKNRRANLVITSR
jgi:peptidoglycan-associated lipoprotein